MAQSLAGRPKSRCHPAQHPLSSTAPSKLLSRLPGSLYPRGIRGRLILLLLVILVPVLVVQVGIYYRHFEETRARELQANLEVARALAATFESYLQDLLDDELLIGTALISGQPPSAPQLDLLLAAAARENPAIRNFTWVDPQGRALASNQPEVAGLDLGDRPYFQQIVAGREWVVSDLLQGRASGDALFIIARGIRDSAGTLHGVVLATVDPQHLDGVVKARREGQASLGIIDRQLQIVYRYPEVELGWEDRQLVERQPFVAPVLAGQEVSGTFATAPDGQGRLSSYVPIPSVGWIAGAGRPEAEVVAPFLQSVLVDAGSFLLVALGALLLALFISRNIVVPIKRLQRYADALGSGQLDQQVSVVGPTKVEALAATFNSMAQEVERHQEELQLLNEQLQAQAVRLRENEERLSLAISHCPDVMCFEDADLRYTWIANPTPPFTEEQMLGKTDDDLFTPDVAQRLTESKRQVIESGVGTSVELPIGIGAEQRHYEAVFEPRRDDGGRERIERAIVNLLTNALKYSPADRPVVIEVAQQDGEARVAVTDRGMGIAPEGIPHLFQRYYRARAAKKVGGLGLGLYITRLIVEAHGGRVWVESQVGQGSTFGFTLPLAQGFRHVQQ